MNPPPDSPLTLVRSIARWTLGIIWIYQGIVPKLLASVPLEHEAVARTGLFIGTPALTMQLIGVLEVALGLWLLSGWQERAAVVFTSAFLAVMTILVVAVEPHLLIGPFGGIIKNIALFALAWIVWKLSGLSKTGAA